MFQNGYFTLHPARNLRLLDLNLEKLVGFPEVKESVGAQEFFTLNLVHTQPPAIHKKFLSKYSYFLWLTSTIALNKLVSIGSLCFVCLSTYWIDVLLCDINYLKDQRKVIDFQFVSFFPCWNDKSDDLQAFYMSEQETELSKLNLKYFKLLF